VVFLLCLKFKGDRMKIIQIQVVIDRSGVTVVYGLDNEGNVWTTDTQTRSWSIFRANPTQ
jgi:hypothetical protein